MSGATVVYGAFSNYLEKALLRHVFVSTAYTRPTGLWLALYTTLAADTGPGTEPPTVAGYARVAATFADAPDLFDGSSAVWNPALVQFAVATNDWGTVVWMGIHDAATGGNMLAHGPLAVTKTVLRGDAVRFPAQELIVGLQ